MEPPEQIGWLMATPTRKLVFRHVWDLNRQGGFPCMQAVVENLWMVSLSDALVKIVVKELLEKGWLVNRGRKNRFKLYANMELAGIISDWQEERGKERFDQGKFFKLEVR